DENETYQEIETEFTDLDSDGKGDTPQARQLEAQLFRMVDEHLVDKQKPVAKEPWEVTVTARSGRPKIIKFPDGTTGGVYDRGVLAIKKQGEDIAHQIGKTELTAASWDKRGLQKEDLSQFRKWWAQEALAKPTVDKKLIKSWLPHIKTKLIEMEAKNLSDAEIERVFKGTTAKDRLIKYAKLMRESGDLKYSDIQEALAKEEKPAEKRPPIKIPENLRFMTDEQLEQSIYRMLERPLSKAEKATLTKLKRESSRRDRAAEKDTTGISRRRRTQLITQLEDEIGESEIYKEAEEGLDAREREIGPGFYYVPKKFRSEIEHIIGKVKGLPTKLQKMFTFDPGDLAKGATDFERAVQSGLW
ncbi:unnamed protein product, partial [marine sediment metagenome]